MSKDFTLRIARSSEPEKPLALLPRTEWFSCAYYAPSRQGWYEVEKVVPVGVVQPPSFMVWFNPPHDWCSGEEMRLHAWRGLLVNPLRKNPTPGMRTLTTIQGHNITLNIFLPFKLMKGEAERLDQNMHDALSDVIGVVIDRRVHK